MIGLKRSALAATVAVLWLGCGEIRTADDNDTKDPDAIWVTIGADAIDTLNKTLGARAGKSILAMDQGRDVALVQIQPEDIPSLTGAMHADFHRCGGYVLHESYEAALAALDDNAGAKAMKASLVAYSIGNGDVATALIDGLEESRIVDTITSLAGFNTRYYTTQSGIDAAVWIRDLWQSYAASRPEVTVELYDHPAFNQPSVIMTIPGGALADEVVVLGGHLDSTGGFAGATAPGADDDASGIATLSEVARVALASGLTPQRTVKFMAYAAEEVGLRGSKDIADEYAATGVDVVGMMQLDMTNYKGSAEDIVLISDYTNAAQNQFIGQLVDTYLGVPWTYSQCGYGCSDHASWTNAGFVASIPFESLVSQYNPYIHTANDTLDKSGGNAAHAIKFARVAAAYLAELAKGGFGDDGGDPPPPPPPPPPGPVTEDFSGSLSQGAQDHYGPFAVEPGTTFTAQITGTGDADLYVRFGAAPTTSSWDCRPYKNGSSETCNLTVPSSESEAYVMIRGYTSATYNLSVTYTQPGGGGGGGGGEVTENLSGSVATGAQDNYGPYSVVPGTDVTAILSPATGDSGDADIYVRFGAPPTTSSYDCRPYEWGSNETCVLTTPSSASEVYVMVRGYSAAAYEVELTYTTP